MRNCGVNLPGGRNIPNCARTACTLSLVALQGMSQYRLGPRHEKRTFAEGSTHSPVSGGSAIAHHARLHVSGVD